MLHMQTVEERLERQLGTARQGFRLARSRPEVRDTALAWLERHPSGRPEVDVLWRRALQNEGPLSTFLAGDERFDAWVHETLPLRCIVASHPFPDVWRWTLP
jgi:hypothetical protein